MAYIERDIFINNELTPLVKRLDLCHPKQKKGVLMAISKLKEAPTADVAEVKHGKWDINKNCSVCGVYKFEGLDADVWADWDIDYCPHCGAKMDGKDGE